MTVDYIFTTTSDGGNAAPKTPALAGGIVAENYGAVADSWVTGRVEARHSLSGEVYAFAGGIVGRGQLGSSVRHSYAAAEVTARGINGTQATSGGLVGRNKGVVAAAYATGAVRAASVNSRVSELTLNRAFAGGLVGINTGYITAAYATGQGFAEASAMTMGGLVGEHKGAGSITASYATGAQQASDDSKAAMGGLTGKGASDITYSYWDTTASGLTASDGGVGKRRTELQAPTDYTGIYANWNVNADGQAGPDNPWNFGTATQYPILEYRTYLPASEQGE